MADVNNTVVWAEDWVTKLQERLSEPTKWKDICRVEYTDTRVLHNPYLTDATVQSYNRGSVYTSQTVVETDESITISSAKILPQYIDRADLAQSTYMRQMEFADSQAVLLNEKIEAAVFGDYANMTTFDNASIGGSAGSITVSATNVDDIIRTLQQKMLEASGGAMLDRNGAFIVWRPADFNLLTAFMQANGFSTADQALKQGAGAGFAGIDYMGFTHYTSNQLTAQHLIAGVKKVYHLGILRSTYGQIMVNEKDPGERSGISVVSRIDYAGKVWTKVKPLLFNVVVA